MKKRISAAVLAAALALAVPAAALANDCVNVSRHNPGPSEGTVKGNWVDVGGVWLFVSPGTNVEEEFGIPIHVPGENGNYTNGKVDDLLGNSANCKGTTSRQQSHGIQSGCGAEG